MRKFQENTRKFCSAEVPRKYAEVPRIGALTLQPPRGLSFSSILLKTVSLSLSKTLEGDFEIHPSNPTPSLK